ncbi:MULTISPECIES: homoserine kinase [Paenibacillus]|uniref:homoserine kinase n=1 Tax=Paenibacillus TaxID=44249 RepID=UPI0006A6D9D2|nr:MULTISPECIES: homoserine kinase [Paenibacillus]ALA43505.1 serine kinase [Paenibacillus peoriae]APB74700.1 homoserine kinase [Paenibacillus polymyxa]OMF71301.1 homoserine kinase [Paenibacillus peoriae]OMF77986.1 homoserine kinase [Paenibacillus peoriae]POR24884.1 homoserine kinase [Paenibacillus polymyxa]
MTVLKTARVRVPASTANLGPGFDTLGMALSLYAWIEMKEAEQTAFHLYGNEMNGVPQDKTNLIFKVAQMVFREAGVSVPELDISMYSDIPLTRGLGSSASAIVGALVAANTLIGSPLPDSKLFDMASAIEKHPDNVGASLFGGIITAMWDGENARHLRLEPDANLEVMVVIPDFQLSTSKAREVLPAHVSLKDAVYNISHASMLVAALASGRTDLIAEAMRDQLHQPYRAALVPGMTEILQDAHHYGALGVALSGAGPTLLALTDQRVNRKAELEQYLTDTMNKEGITASVLKLRPESEGVKVYTEGNTLPFMDMIKGELMI